MSDENESGGLTDAERESLSRFHPDALEHYDGRRDQNFEPPGSAPKRPDTAPDNAHEERMRISKALADPSRTAVLEAGFKNREEALTRLDELGRAETGEVDQQTQADGDYAPRSVNDYQFEKGDGQSWNDEAAAELTQIRGELHKAGVNAGIANTIFQHDAKPYFQVSDEAWRSRIETTAAKIASKEGGKQVIDDAERFLNSGLSETLLEAACVACGSEMGIKELARLGRGLARKGAH